MVHGNMKPSEMGYTMKDGRLINNAPEPISGISQAAMLRKQMKSRTITQDIADGIELADQRKSIRDVLKGL